MRILLLAHAPSVHTQRWARALSERGHEVRLLSVRTAPGAPFPGEAVGAPRAPIPALRYLVARGAVRSALATRRPDVTVAHFLPNYGFLAAIAGARPFALVAWGSDLLVNARRTPFHAARAGWVLRRAGLVHVDAAHMAEAARSLGAPAGRVWTRAWGVDAEALAPVRAWAARRGGVAGARILWTRMLEPLYDPETFLRALSLLRARGVAFDATIAGEGPLRATLEAAARRAGLGGSVRFEGFVGEERLRALYRDHEIYVSMSRSDSTSQSLLEAMAAGLYAVVSDIEGNRPWIGERDRPGDARARRGALVPVGDAAALAAAIADAAEDRSAAARVEAAIAYVRAEGEWADTVSQTETRLDALARGVGP